MASIVSSVADRQQAERKFYSRMALFLLLVALLGFAPSFYLRGVIPSGPRPLPSMPTWVLVHGILFSLWMLILVAQTQLVAAGRRDLHKALGAASMLLALLIIPLMYFVAVWQVERGSGPPFADPLNWTIVPLAVIPAFAYLVWSGWKRRREAQWHKRMMLGAAIVVVMGPAVGRLPIAPPTLGGFTFQLLLGLSLFAPLFVWDRRSLGRTHPATWRAFGAGAAATAIPLLFLATGAWAPIAAYLPGV